MSVPMPVMISTIIMESWSSENARSTVSRPAVNMFQSVCWRKRSSAGSPLSWTKDVGRHREGRHHGAHGDGVDQLLAAAALHRLRLAEERLELPAEERR